MSAIEGHTGTILNIFILIILIAWILLDKVIQKRVPTIQPLNEASNTTTTPMITTKEQPFSYRLLLKIILAIQIITLALIVLIYLKS